MNVQKISARAWGDCPRNYRRERRGQLALIAMQRESIRLGLNPGFQRQYVLTIEAARQYLAELRAVYYARKAARP